MQDGSITKIFITGSSGFIGNALVDKLLENKNISLCLFNRKDNLSYLFKTFHPDIVIHSAAEIYNESLMFNSNVELTYRLLELSEEININKFVYIGSSSEYGRYDIPISESFKLKPTTKYEATKGAGSLFCEASKLNTLIIRPFSVYGPGEPSHRFIPKIYDAYINKQILNITEGTHDFIYIDNFIDILISRINIPYKEILNVGTGLQYKNIDVVNIFEKIVNDKINKNILETKGRSFDSNNWANNIEYLSSVYKKQLLSLEEGLKRYVQFRKKNS